MQLVEGSVVAGRFRLVRELGRGGMGSVWLAQHTGLDTLCAIKFIDKEGQNSPEMRQRFELEAKAAAQLRSAHVVQVHDHGVWEDTPYIAMEYLEGEDLAHRLDRVGRLSRAETSRIVSQVARALTKAHAAGIVHRDLKPENIFLVRDEEAEIAKVVDFGIAKRVRATVEDHGTKDGSLLGTPFYMSPEQARGTREVDHRSDLWALGVIAYQCLAGQVPFSSEGLGDILAQIMFEPMPVPSQRAAGISTAFDAWWARACARPVEERFQSARELGDALVVALGVSQGRAEEASLPDFESASPAAAETAATPMPTAIRAPLGAYPPATASTPQPETVPTANTDNPLSLTYQPASQRTRRRRRLRVVAAGVTLTGLLALGMIALRRGGRALDRTAGQGSPPQPAATLVATHALRPATIQPSVNPVNPVPAPPAVPSSRPPARVAKPATPPPTRKRMDFGI